MIASTPESSTSITRMYHAILCGNDAEYNNFGCYEMGDIYMVHKIYADVHEGHIEAWERESTLRMGEYCRYHWEIIKVIRVPIIIPFSPNQGCPFSDEESANDCMDTVMLSENTAVTVGHTRPQLYRA